MVLEFLFVAFVFFVRAGPCFAAVQVSPTGWEAGVDVRVLGPLQVWEDGQELALGGIRPSALLAMLVLNLGRVVSMGALIDGLWGPEPPANVTNSIHVSVSRLRKTLHGGGPAARPSVLVLEPSRRRGATRPRHKSLGLLPLSLSV